MNYVLRMRVGHHRRLAALLRAAMPAESVAFLLCRRAPSADGVVFLVDEVIELEPSAYAAQAHDVASVAPLVMAVNAGQEPLLFAGEVAVLMRGGFSRTAPAGLAWF